jgi:tRNA nucleotidyltransferase/poly(A) polymerase
MDKAKQIIRAVEEIVSPVYLVGGSVRDVLLEKEPKDYDFTTPLSPDEVEARALAAGRHVYGIGKKFGTIGFKVPTERGRFEYVEITTFRREKYEEGNRKPQVEFVSELKDDLSRRDFTFNAIALDTNFEFIDPFGGRLEILAKKIKPVGNAKDRFKEDPLRMLRAARFASQLGFEVDPNMIGIIRKLGYTILDVSRERWVQELDKLLLTEHPEKGFSFLYESSLMKYMIPELLAVFADYNVREQTFLDLTNSPADADIRWGILLQNTSRQFFHSSDIMEDNNVVRGERQVSQEIAHGIAMRLKFSNARAQTLADVITNKNTGNKNDETKLQVPAL